MAFTKTKTINGKRYLHAAKYPPMDKKTADRGVKEIRKIPGVGAARAVKDPKSGKYAIYIRKSF